MDTFDIQKYLVASTAHLPKWLVDAMESKDATLNFCYELTDYGATVYLDTWYEIGKKWLSEFPKEIQSIVLAARLADCERLSFDCDGRIYTEFPLYEW